MNELVRKLLEKDPLDRPVDAHRIHQDLLAMLREREIAAPPTPEAGQMLSRAFGAKQRAPFELLALPGKVDALVSEVVALRAESVDAQRSLEEIDLRGREKRAQLGFAVVQLGVDGSKCKEDLRSARDAHKRAEEDCTGARERFFTAHREVLTWEGRSGFLEPWADLAQAYRVTAAAVDEWNTLRVEERRVQALVETAELRESDLDFQVRELRAALAKHEQDLDEARETCRVRIATNGTTADGIERQLLELTSRFCQPLRERPELEPLFKELQTAAA